MVEPSPPAESKPKPLRRWTGPAVGVIAGLLLWALIASLTGSGLLGFAFGLVPGLVIWAGLALSGHRG
ncbi:hypothetical protein [Hyphobacterium marinum]|uniref:Uncharacterized protein n=1 Tax=Hyphobacterium marinum TaxID=3116574 RepID=A0ABU7LW17_9PROT|nr:hypothetical protein [Hyphobacterium sp. Y6023]MEE2565472.1 hypothetical protein [Hyphobacterium sp. Y6023]